MDVGIVPRDDTTDAVDALYFVGRIVPSALGGVEDPRRPGTFCRSELPTRDTDADTYPIGSPASAPTPPSASA